MPKTASASLYVIHCPSLIFFRLSTYTNSHLTPYHGSGGISPAYHRRPRLDLTSVRVRYVVKKSGTWTGLPRDTSYCRQVSCQVEQHNILFLSLFVCARFVDWASRTNTSPWPYSGWLGHRGRLSVKTKNTERIELNNRNTFATVCC